MDNVSSQRKVKCPRCGGISIYSAENPSRPFCSERCQLLDLGAWASEEYRVPTSQNQDYLDSQDEKSQEPS